MKRETEEQRERGTDERTTEKSEKRGKENREDLESDLRPSPTEGAITQLTADMTNYTRSYECSFGFGKGILLPFLLCGRKQGCQKRLLVNPFRQVITLRIINLH